MKELHIFSFTYLGGVDMGIFTPYFDRIGAKLSHYIYEVAHGLQDG
jgi:hypothetical protein